MSRDRREEIAARLLLIAQGLVGPDRAFRNETSVTAKTAPALVVWDGDETTPTEAGEADPQPVELRPEIRILYEASAASIGTAINALRLQVLRAVLSDADLLAACSASARGRRRIIYVGCGPGLEAGRRVEGELSLNFLFRYRLVADELAP
jgi:hypothetical protein